ncbi:adenylate kinase family enzyme [Actinoplanes tereljensis]|nr:adenylate kinase [Actinoplanes tereljensis]
MRRIMVYGVSGAGKSTLAERIGERLGVPYHPIDDLTWEPGWVEVPDEIQRARITAICDGDAWVIDAGYGRWVDIPMARVDLIVGLDFPRWVSLGRLLRRSVIRIVTHEPICNGNYESIRKTLFASDSILRWHFRKFKHNQRRMRAWHADPGKPPVVLLTSPAGVERWWSGVGNVSA